jgi:hypothetical protein
MNGSAGSSDSQASTSAPFSLDCAGGSAWKLGIVTSSSSFVPAGRWAVVTSWT